MNWEVLNLITLLHQFVRKYNEYLLKALEFPFKGGVPRGFPLQQWFQTNSWNLLFKPMYHQFNVKNVMLR